MSETLKTVLDKYIESQNKVVFRENAVPEDKDGYVDAIKKSLTDDGPETTVKLDFKGNEDIFTIKRKLDNAIEKDKKIENSNKTDQMVNILNIMPSSLIRVIVKFLMFLDKHGLLARKIIELSPFHTSTFVTNVGSIGIDSIYHHLYDFGTTSMFFSIGKKKKSYIYNEDEIEQDKCITVAFVGDERICDGYYYASSFKTLNKYLRKPELLENEGSIKQKTKEHTVL